MANYLIIGASSGIGEELVKQLNAEGHTVYGTYHSHQVIHDSIHYQKLNVLDEDLHLDLPEELEGLVYSPGSIQLRPFNRIKADEFIKDLQLNLAGAVKVIQLALPKLKNGVAPSILLFSTVAVKLGLPFHSMVAASKGAIEGFTRALAAELAPKIRVNCIAPSLTDTPLANSLLSTADKKQANADRHPLKKIGSSADIAQMASFILSSRASWITGQILAVDGGLSSLKTG